MNTIYFMTHVTLTERHARLCLASIKHQTQTFWDQIVIYNTNQDELSNDRIREIAREYELTIPLVDYGPAKSDKLVTDMCALKSYAIANPIDGFIMILKSEFCLSSRFNEVVKGMPIDNKWIWTPPVIHAKEFVTDLEIHEYQSRQTFLRVDPRTYYRGSDIHAPTGEEGPGDGMTDIDPNIHFVSHRVRMDFNVHVMPHDVFIALPIDIAPSVTWGGMAVVFRQAADNGIRYLNIDDAFAIHVFHEIISKNRAKDRGDRRKTIPGQKY